MLTDDHNGELNTLLDFVAPASAGERHGDDVRMEENERDVDDVGDRVFVVEGKFGLGRRKSLETPTDERLHANTVSGG